MAEEVSLYSSYPITFEELSTAILAAGGEPVPPEKRYGLDLLGRLEDGHRALYIYGDSEPGDPTRFWEQGVYDLGEKIMEEITAKLGGKPVVSFMLKIGHAARSGLLAVELAYHCTQRWSCVVWAEVFEDGMWKNKVYTKGDIESLQMERKAFTTYGMLDDDDE